MNKREFAAWYKTLIKNHQADAAYMCFAAMVTFEGVSLDVLRDGIRRSLEDCWQARLPDHLENALELMKAEMAVLHGEST